MNNEIGKEDFVEDEETDLRIWEENYASYGLSNNKESLLKLLSSIIDKNLQFVEIKSKS